MKRPLVFALLTFLAVASISIVVLVARQRERQRHWPAEMNRRCHSLAGSILEFREARSRYPASLDELVSEGVLTRSDLSALSFQASTGADPLPWNYFPEAPRQVILVSPGTVIPWPGHSGFHHVGFDDSSVQAMSHDKWRILQRDIARGNPTSR